jgi:hypothetical protein
VIRACRGVTGAYRDTAVSDSEWTVRVEGFFSYTEDTVEGSFYPAYAGEYLITRMRTYCAVPQG